MANPIVWFEIYVEEMKRAKAFYEEVFDVKLQELPGPDIEMQAFPMDMNAPGAAGALVKMTGFPVGGGSTIVYFHCEDCAVEEARATNAGGRVHQQKMSIGEYGFVSLVYDTEGNMIGLNSQK